MRPLLLGQRIQLFCGLEISEPPLLKDGYWEVWCASGETRLLIHLYHDGKVVATTSNGDLWVFDRLEVIQEKNGRSVKPMTDKNPRGFAVHTVLQ
jgi:hypothetical protein